MHRPNHYRPNTYKARTAELPVTYENTLYVFMVASWAMLVMLYVLITFAPVPSQPVDFTDSGVGCTDDCLDNDERNTPESHEE